MNQQNILIFGDQTTSPLAALRNLIQQSKKSATLKNFLQQTTDIVQTETFQLNPDERPRFFGFRTLLDLAEEHAKRDEADGLVGSILANIVKLGELIVYVDNDPTLFGSMSSVVTLVGVCTGLLPAAALTAAGNTTELISIGLEILRVNIRLSVDTDRVARQLEDAPYSCWGYLFLTSLPESIQEILDDFHQSQGLSRLNQAYISVTSQWSATVCGPPSTLEQLFAYSDALSKFPKMKLPINALVHAGHLPLLDLDRIIGASPIHDTVIPRHRTRLYSTSTYAEYSARTLRELLTEILKDITQAPLNMSEVFSNITAKQSRARNLSITVVGPVTSANAIQDAFEKEGTKVVLHATAEVKSTSSLRSGSEKIAIVGMSGRFPNSDSIDEFWKDLMAGIDTHKEIPEDRFSLKDYYDPTNAGDNKTSTPYGCFLKNPGLFDSQLFNMSPREAAQTDPLQRLLLMVTYEALESAGFVPGSLCTDTKQVATYFGQANDAQRDIGRIQGADIYFVPGIARAFSPGRLNHFFKWEGGCYSLDTACSSGATGVMLGCSALLARECDTVIAGGGSILNEPYTFAGLSKGGFVSKTGNCRTFQDTADGYCRGEGVSVVVLKRLEDAVASNDRILAVISATGRNHSALASSITHPHSGTQQKLMNRIIQQADMTADQVNFVEMHGTATQAGDVAEMDSVINTVGKQRTKSNPLFLGAVKANIGHGEAVAGISSLIKSVLMLKERTIPPQPGMPFALNKKFPPLERMNVHIPAKPTPLTAGSNEDGKRRILINSFDAAGGNTSLIIEEGPSQMAKENDPRTSHVVVCTARTQKSLHQNKERLLGYLKSHPDTKISDLAYTTTARRLHQSIKHSYCASTTKDLTRLIEADLQKDAAASKQSKTGLGPVAFVFTGQGSQYAGMGHELFRSSPRFQEKILSLHRMCKLLDFPDFLDIITSKDTNLRERDAMQMQLALVCLEIALADLWVSWGVKPELVIGHSLGEYAALCVSGVLSEADTLHLVGSRAQLLATKCTRNEFSMLAIGASAEDIRAVLDSKDGSSCQIACMNGPESNVVSGRVEDIKALQEILLEKNFKCKLLEVEYGFHSQQLDPILADLEKIGRGVHFLKPKIPVASTLTGAIVQDLGVFDTKYIARQAREPVHFVDALQAAKSAQLVNDRSAWIEIGPSPICLGMVRSTLQVPSTALLPTLRLNEDCWDTISRSLAEVFSMGREVAWTEYHRDYLQCLSFLSLPTYAFDVKNYWTPFKEREALPIAVPLALPSVPAPFISTSLQRVVKESQSGGKISVTFESRTNEKDLFEAIQGHQVLGVPVCPGSVFGDMAIAAAKYVYEKRNPGKTVPATFVEKLNIVHPLALCPSDSNQTVQVSAISTADKDWTVAIAFDSKVGSSSHHHGTCFVTFGDAKKWAADWARHSWFVKERIDAITKSDQVLRMSKRIAYKLFDLTVGYGPRYQALEQVYVDSEVGDAVAKVKLQSDFGTGHYISNPYWTDPIVHLAGLLLNTIITTDEDSVCVSYGIDDMRISEDLRSDKTYTTYVRAESDGPGLWAGDVYIFDGDNVIALCHRIKFQTMKRKTLTSVFDSMLPGTGLSHPAPQHVASASKSSKQSLKLPEQQLPARPQTPDSLFDSSSTSDGESTEEECNTADTSFQSTPKKMTDLFLNTVLEETGYDPLDVNDSTTFAEMGVDSLMSVTIMDSLRKATGVDLPVSFMTIYPTVGEARCELLEEEPEDVEIVVLTPPRSRSGSFSEETVQPRLTEVTGEKFEQESSQDVKKSKDISGIVVKRHLKAQVPDEMLDITSQGTAVIDFEILPSQPLKKPLNLENFESRVMLLHGNPKNGKTPLFLLSDGVGSGSVFIHIPPLPTGLAVYAMDSPFLQNPEEYTCSLEETAAIFLRSIKKIQPEGPYMIGGWSAGSFYAYEVARQLLLNGEKVLGLIIVDMHCPHMAKANIRDAAVQNAPDMMDLMDGNIWRLANPRENCPPLHDNTKAHLKSTIQALVNYDALPMSKDLQPNQTYIIWGTRGLDKKMLQEMMNKNDNNDNDDPDFAEFKEVMIEWFFGERTDFGPRGWNKYVGDRIKFGKINANHFFMVNPPHATALGRLLGDAVESFMAEAE